jgi:branched-chain amino acid aminotransferase
MKTMIQTWQITRTQSVKLDMPAATLDEVTRQLPGGFYSTFRTFDECTRVLGLNAHLSRLYQPVPLPEVDALLLRRQLLALLEPYRPGEARVRVVMTTKGQVYLAAEPLKPLPREVYENGVRVETTALHRRQPRLKSTGFIGRSDAERKHIAEEGIFEALLVKGGQVLEGMTSNFFYVGQAAGKGSLKTDKVHYLATARENILLGITRETVLEIARGIGLEIKYQPLKLDQLEMIPEAFITSSTRGIVPVIQIDQVTIGEGIPGSITRQLSESYNSYVIENAERIL